jgi:hypothetical protein
MKITALLAAVLLAACAHTETRPAEAAAAAPALPAVATAPRPDAAKPDGRAAEFAKTKVQIVEPKHDQNVGNGAEVKVTVKLDGYAIGNGPHVHVILDNDPYLRADSVAAPVVLKNVKPGGHLLRVFASRPWHESLKGEGNFAMVRFVVGTDDGAFKVDAAKPVLTYSRPKGDYKGPDAAAVMVDFVLKNDDLAATGHKVKLTIDGKSQALLDRWEPIWVPGLANGEHLFALELVDASGALVDNGGANRAERKVVVDATVAAPAAGHTGH